RFWGAHPDVLVRLVEPHDANTAVRMVREGSTEVGFVELPVPGGDPPAHPIEDHDYVAVLAADVADGLGARRLSLSALSRLPLITTPRGTSTRRLIDDAFTA